MSISGISAASTAAYIKQTQATGQAATTAQPAQDSDPTQAAPTQQPGQVHHHHHRHGGGSAPQASDITQSGTSAAANILNTFA